MNTPPNSVGALALLFSCRVCVRGMSPLLGHDVVRTNGVRRGLGSVGNESSIVNTLYVRTSHGCIRVDCFKKIEKEDENRIRMRQYRTRIKRIRYIIALIIKN